MSELTCRRVTSRDNPLVRRIRTLAVESAEGRRTGEAWIEGEHLCAAMVRRRQSPLCAVLSDSAWAIEPLRRLSESAEERVVIPDALMEWLSPLPSPAGMGFVIAVDRQAVADRGAPAVILDRLQDAGNVGSILRSASALGFNQVWALKGTAWLWSAKVLRAGMGAHFGLNLVEGLTLGDLADCRIPWVAASSRARHDLTQTVLPRPCCWVFGHEGQGISAQAESRCDLTVRIPQPGGEDSLNVAAAAAVCLYESMRQQGLTG